MKKRVLSMAMATVMAASLTACGSSSTATTAAPTETNADTSALPPKPHPKRRFF